MISCWLSHALAIFDVFEIEYYISRQVSMVQFFWFQFASGCDCDYDWMRTYEATKKKKEKERQMENEQKISAFKKQLLFVEASNSDKEYTMYICVCNIWTRKKNSAQSKSFYQSDFGILRKE